MKNLSLYLGVLSVFFTIALQVVDTAKLPTARSTARIDGSSQRDIREPPLFRP
jgi:hypothetical protein